MSNNTSNPHNDNQEINARSIRVFFNLSRHDRRARSQWIEGKKVRITEVLDNMPKKCDGCNLPLIGVDRFYQWDSGDRIEVNVNMFDYSPLQGKKVLLIAGHGRYYYRRDYSLF